MTIEDRAAAWGTWLQAQLNQRDWRAADLVRASGGSIKPDRASKWLSGKERPSHRYALITANTLGASPKEALDVSGYEVANPQRAADRYAAETAEMNVVRGRLAQFDDRQLLLELLRRESEARYSREYRESLVPQDVVPGEDTSGTDVFSSILSAEESRKEDQGLAANEGPLTPDLDQATQEEPEDDDDARPGA